MNELTAISRSIEKRFNCDLEEVKHLGRTKQQTYIRHLWRYQLRKRTKLSLMQISRETSNGHLFDHATIIHSIKTVKNLIEAKNHRGEAINLDVVSDAAFLDHYYRKEMERLVCGMEHHRRRYHYRAMFKRSIFNKIILDISK